MNAVLASTARRTTKASLQARDPSCGVTRQPAQADAPTITAPANTSQRPRSTTGTAFPTRIQVGNHWASPWVAPAKVAATSVLNAR